MPRKPRAPYQRPPRIYKHRVVIHLSDLELAQVNALRMLSEFNTPDGRESGAVVIRKGLEMLTTALKPVVDGLVAALEIKDEDDKRKEVYRIYLNHLPLLKPFQPK